MAFFRRKQVRRAPKKAVKKAAPRRRLGLRGATTGPNMGYAAGYGLAKAVTRPYYKQKAMARANYQSRIEASDNITSSSAVTIGKQRKISFQEKISRAFREPFTFKRNYQFTAEGYSARKSWFTLDLNVMNNDDLNIDVQNYKNALLTNTSQPASWVSSVSGHDKARYYVDKLTEKIQMSNSSTNSITGRIHLIAHKRDNDNNYFGVSGLPIRPVNMLMYYLTNSISAITGGVGGEGTVGNGFKFDGVSVVGLNYLSNYNMPGCSINAAGICASTDHSITLFHKSVAQQVGFWFRKVNTKSFSLKAGQQTNFSYVFNDMKKIYREQSEFVHLAGITYSLVVEFESQIVGSDLTTNNVATGSSQLSVIRDSTRVLGLENTITSQNYLMTAPQTAIADANQVTINQDSGVLDVGLEKDL